MPELNDPTYDNNGTCRCGDTGEPSHTCPFKEEMSGTNQYEECNCCDSCRTDCARDV